MREAQPDIEAAGAKIAAVGASADYQVAHLLKTEGDAVLLYLDPEKNVQAAIGLGKIATIEWFRPSVWKRYFEMSKGRKNDKRIPLRHTMAEPGCVIVGPDLEIVWAHRGKSLGDYPEVATILAELRRASA